MEKNTNLSIAQIADRLQIEKSETGMALFSGRDFYNEFKNQAVRIDALTISFCKSGSAEGIISDREYKIDNGFVSVKTPGTISLWDWISDDYEGCEVVISMDFLKKLPLDMRTISTVFAYLKRESIFQLTDKQKKNFFHLLCLIEGLSENLDHYETQALQGAAASLLYALCDLIRQSEERFDGEIVAGKNRDRKHYYFLNFLELLGKHSHCERSVAFYADRMALSPKYLSSIIKEISGKSAAEWIDEYVMMEAKAILQHPKANVAEAAHRLNFPNTSFFGQYFKKRSGMSPGDFKKRYAG